jgi:hypothetical protein
MSEGARIYAAWQGIGVNAALRALAPPAPEDD